MLLHRDHANNRELCLPAALLPGDALGGGGGRGGTLDWSSLWVDYTGFAARQEVCSSLLRSSWRSGLHKRGVILIEEGVC